jgi:hypothetical protein
VARSTVAGSMKNTDVQPTRHRIRITDNYVLRHSTVGKTAAVKRDLELLDPNRFWLRRKLKYVFWQRNRPRNNTLSVVVALEHKDLNSCSVKTGYLSIKKQSD